MPDGVRSRVLRRLENQYLPSKQDVWVSQRLIVKHKLREGGLVMDLPVSLAIGLAFTASIWATVTGSGQVYFDSVTMFTFFLLLGRFFESQGRRRLVLHSLDINDVLPSYALRGDGDNWPIPHQICDSPLPL